MNNFSLTKKLGLKEKTTKEFYENVVPNLFFQASAVQQGCLVFTNSV